MEEEERNRRVKQDTYEKANESLEREFESKLDLAVVKEREEMERARRIAENFMLDISDEIKREVERFAAHQIFSNLKDVKHG